MEKNSFESAIYFLKGFINPGLLDAVARVRPHHSGHHAHAAGTT